MGVRKGALRLCHAHDSDTNAEKLELNCRFLPHKLDGKVTNAHARPRLMTDISQFMLNGSFGTGIA